MKSTFGVKRKKLIIADIFCTNFRYIHFVFWMVELVFPNFKSFWDARRGRWLVYSYSELYFCKYIKGTLMQIWKSLYMFMFI